MIVNTTKNFIVRHTKANKQKVYATIKQLCTIYSWCIHGMTSVSFLNDSRSIL